MSEAAARIIRTDGGWLVKCGSLQAGPFVSHERARAIADHLLGAIMVAGSQGRKPTPAERAHKRAALAVKILRGIGGRVPAPLSIAVSSELDGPGLAALLDAARTELEAERNPARWAVAVILRDANRILRGEL